MLQKILKFFNLNKQRRISLAQQGVHWDLKEIFKRLNAHYFHNELDLPIGWFGNRHVVPRSSVRLGSYHARRKVIKIHRLLDQAHVPEFFISYIVYHEMLHHVLPPLQAQKRRRIHHPEFLRREKEFEEYTLAKEFFKNLKITLFNKS